MSGIRLAPATPTDDSYAIPCPDCGAAADEPCVYLPLKGVDAEFIHYRSSKVQARHALTGKPTKRPHIGRINAAFDRAHRRRQRELRKAQHAAVVPASRARLDIQRAHREYDIREFEAIRAWLTLHAHILIGSGK